MKLSIKAVVSFLIIISIVVSNLYARDLRAFEKNAASPRNAAGVDTVNTGVLVWPQHSAEQQTGKINASFHDNGIFGSSSGYSPSLTYPMRSFESPSFSGTEYLYMGTLWVSGIVGSDTLVSVGSSGWGAVQEFQSEIDNNTPSMRKEFYPSDYSLRTKFNDTLISGDVDDWTGRIHIPLNIKISNRSHVWRTDPLDNAIFYDMVITNMGDEIIEDAYVGFLFDADLGNYPYNNNVHVDDLVGSIRESGIAYMIDDDGDPDINLNIYNEFSPTKAYAFEFLATSFIPIDTNLNWWLSSGTSSLDFGPRLKDTIDDPFRDFGTGGTGTPVGDANKYYIMSHKEWDYDQVFTYLMSTLDSIWLPPAQNIAIDFSVGADSRFLISIGPVTLNQGESQRIIYSTFTADSVHIDVNNYENNLSQSAENPSVYINNLNLDNIVTVGNDIKQALTTILDPLTPPMGLDVDSFELSWDPWVFDDVVGYEIYATEVDASTFPFPGAIPPWYRPDAPTHIASVGLVTDYSLSEAETNFGGLTAINVAHQTSTEAGDYSGSQFVNIPKPKSPVVSTYSVTTSTDLLQLTWNYDPDVDHYKIYKSEDYGFESYITKPFYSENASSINFLKDSIEIEGVWWYYHASSEPYATVGNGDTTFLETEVIDDSYYYLVAVDVNGFESDVANTQAAIIAEQTRDILVVTNNDPVSSFVTSDYIIDFYDSILIGMDYEIFSIKDSNGCASDELCPNWKEMTAYNLIIFDDTDNDNLLDRDYTADHFTKLTYHRKVAYFGAFTKVVPLETLDPTSWRNGQGFVYYSYSIDSIFYSGGLSNMVNPEDYLLTGFYQAEPASDSFPVLEADVDKYPLSEHWDDLNMPFNEPPIVAAFKLIEDTSITVTHRYRSMYPETSLADSAVVGFRKEWSNQNNYMDISIFGFHLYYMKQQQARNLIMSLLGFPLGSCCINPTGDIDNGGQVLPDINDLLFLIDYMFLLPGAAPAPVCMEEANVDGEGEAIPNISDLLYLVDYMFNAPGSFPEPVFCQ